MKRGKRPFAAAREFSTIIDGNNGFGPSIDENADSQAFVSFGPK